MPRPKPPAPRKARHIRMSDEAYAKFKEHGGAPWLERLFNTRPARYWEVFERPKNNAGQNG